MSKERLGRLVIVLFLLATLPGMTAVMAQGQEPAVKEMPAGSVMPASAAEWGETTVQYSVWEVEPNNSLAAAKEVDIVSPPEVIRAGVFNGDVDWYKFYVNATPTGVLINTDADMDGENTDTVVKLYNSSGTLLTTNDDVWREMGQYDSLLWTVLKTGWYYVAVSDFPDNGNCTSNCYYELIITRPILISASAANLGTGANVEGIPFRSEDVLALSPLANDYNDQPQHKWWMFLDGSDVGITKPVVNIGLGWVNDFGEGTLSLGFGANQKWRDWQGVMRTFKPQDWAVITFAQVGINSVLPGNGSGWPLVEYHAGSEHGLTTTAEKVDAFDLNPEYGTNPAWTANVFQSTTGAASVPKYGGGVLKAADEDLFRSTAAASWTGWRNFAHFDGSTVTGLGVEDIFAADYEASRDRIALTILGTGNVLNHPVTQKDIFFLDKLGSQWTWHTMIHLPDYGWNYNIDAIECGGN